MTCGSLPSHQRGRRWGRQEAEVETTAGGLFKCNFDGAFYPSLGQGATGVVIRDPIGNFSGGRAKGHPFCLDALTMEATAFKEGMILARVWVFAK